MKDHERLFHCPSRHNNSTCRKKREVMCLPAMRYHFLCWNINYGNLDWSWVACIFHANDVIRVVRGQCGT